MSVIVPAYNAAADLEANLPPLFEEIGGGVEVIVVDDGSSDATAAVAERLGARVIRQQNRGPAAARNVGARAARGEILVFLDADCRVTPGWLVSLLRPLRETEADAVKGSYLTDQESPVARLCQIEFQERYALLRRRPVTDFVDSFSMGIRRALFLEVGGFDESFRRADNEDVDLSFRLAARGSRLAFAPEARVTHRHPDTLARYFRLKLSRGYHRMRVYERYPGKALRDSYTPLSLKGQMAGFLLLLGALAAAVPAYALGLFRPVLSIAALGALAATASTLGFLRRVGRTDAGLLPVAVPFLAARATALLAGVLARLMRAGAPAPKRG